MEVLKIKRLLEELEDIEWYSPTVHKNWQEYHSIIRKLCEMLSAKLLKEALDYYQDFIGFNLTKAQFLKIMIDPLKWDIIDSGPDTSNREWFMNLLAQEIVGKDWPTGAASQEKVEEFCKLMKSKGREKGYNIPDDWKL